MNDAIREIFACHFTQLGQNHQDETALIFEELSKSNICRKDMELTYKIVIDIQNCHKNNNFICCFQLTFQTGVKAQDIY